MIPIYKCGSLTDMLEELVFAFLHFYVIESLIPETIFCVPITKQFIINDNTVFRAIKPTLINLFLFTKSVVF